MFTSLADVSEDVLFQASELQTFQHAHCKELQREENDVGVVVGTSSMISSVGECIWLTHCLSRLVAECEVKVGEVQGPSGLPSVELFGRHEVLQVLMVSPDLTGVFCTFHEVLPLLQSSDNHQHLFVMDLVVLFNCGEQLGEESDWMPFLVFHGHLGEDCAGREVGTVSFYAEWFGRVGGDENWGSGDTLLQPVEGRPFGVSLAPSRIVPSQVKERVCSEKSLINLQ